MVENIHRHMEEEVSGEAALKGSREIGFTIISITVYSICGVIPVLLMGGIIGRHLQRIRRGGEQPAIVASAFVSLTLTPSWPRKSCRSRTNTKRRNAGAGISSVGSMPCSAATIARCSSICATRRGCSLSSAQHFRGHRVVAHDNAQGLFPQEKDIGSSRSPLRRGRHLV